MKKPTSLLVLTLSLLLNGCTPAHVPVIKVASAKIVAIHYSTDGTNLRLNQLQQIVIIKVGHEEYRLVKTINVTPVHGGGYTLPVNYLPGDTVNVTFRQWGSNVQDISPIDISPL